MQEVTDAIVLLRCVQTILEHMSASEGENTPALITTSINGAYIALANTQAWVNDLQSSLEMGLVA